MLIQALCSYYDVLAAQGKFLPEAYSEVKIHYLVALTPDGRMDSILDWQERFSVRSGKGKIREQILPRKEVMPRRTEKPGIDPNIAEHRPLYLFGLNYEDGTLTPFDRTNKAQKSHAAFREANLAFLEGLDSPVVNAFRAFVQNWTPEAETENPHLLSLEKKYSAAGFSFCLTGYPDKPLHLDPRLREKWERQYSQLAEAEASVMAQCAVTGEMRPVARIHDKIKGLPGGLATGSVLVGFNNSSENSYGNDQSYNSNISEEAMRKYTQALNLLLASSSHRQRLDDLTVVHWASDGGSRCDDLFGMLTFDETAGMDAGQTEDLLKQLMKAAAEGKILPEQIASVAGIDPGVDFYIVGLKPNSSRIAVKFLYRKKFGEILANIARHQGDLRIGTGTRPVPLWQIREALLPPKNDKQTLDPELVSRLLEAIVYGRNYPAFLLSAVVRRVKTDVKMDITSVRAGLIKACINRKSRLTGQKEELTLSLDLQNRTPAYLCGRLFAVLEKLQQEASGNLLNTTIRDAYFASASSKPALVFPKLLRLAQNHLSKLKNPVFYNKLIGEIIDGLGNEFPDTLLLTDQGKFIIGYYQQHQSFFTRKENRQEEI